jgi:hypothetical protein
VLVYFFFFLFPLPHSSPSPLPPTLLFLSLFRSPLSPSLPPLSILSQFLNHVLIYIIYLIYFFVGLYFAENSSKSNQYCHAGACTNSGAQVRREIEDRENKEGKRGERGSRPNLAYIYLYLQAASCRCTHTDELCLLVCRVTLGDPLVESIFR